MYSILTLLINILENGPQKTESARMGTSTLARKSAVPFFTNDAYSRQLAGEDVRRCFFGLIVNARSDPLPLAAHQPRSRTRPDSRSVSISLAAAT